MLQLIQFFLSQKYEVNFGTTSQKNPNSIDLTKLGVKEFELKLNSSSFDELLQHIDPTIVLFDRFIMEEQFGWRVTESCPNALRILDTEDLHCLRKERHKAIKKGIEFSNGLLQNSELTKREIASIYRCDLSLIISTYEMFLLECFFNIDTSLLCHLPFLINTVDPKTINEWKSFEERTHFISIGNFLHAPNVDATLELKNRIWPLIRKELPKVELHVYGAYPTQQMLELNDPSSKFFVHGFVKNAKEVIEASRVLLAPLRFGAGIKGKLIEAMLCGTPSVTTLIGAEGMHNDLPWNGFVEGDIERFAEKAIALYTHEKEWYDHQKNGIEIINQLYAKKMLEQVFSNRIQELLENIKSHRSKNFIGQMLTHHLMQSTKYMSKWIEEKNK